jgi:hypothetical protein
MVRGFLVPPRILLTVVDCAAIAQGDFHVRPCRSALSQ